MEKIRLGELVCTLKRSKRKTVAVRISRDGETEVLAPCGIASGDILRIIGKYENKIQAECEKRRTEAKKRTAVILDYGMAVPCLGGNRIIRKADDRTAGSEADSFFVPSGLAGDELRNAVICEYKKLAAEYIPARVGMLSATMGLEPSAIKINSALSHWASCSRKSSLNFSWYCIMADPGAIDYIIIHELCHMRHFNHSPEFWAEVERCSPDYREYKIYLKGLWKRIFSENWFGDR